MRVVGHMMQLEAAQRTCRVAHEQSCMMHPRMATDPTPRNRSPSAADGDAASTAGDGTGSRNGSASTRSRSDDGDGEDDDDEEDEDEDDAGSDGNDASDDADDAGNDDDDDEDDDAGGAGAGAPGYIRDFRVVLDGAAGVAGLPTDKLEAMRRQTDVWEHEARLIRDLRAAVAARDAVALSAAIGAAQHGSKNINIEPPKRSLEKLHREAERRALQQQVRACGMGGRCVHGVRRVRGGGE